MLLTWTPGRVYPTERNHRISYAEKFWVVAPEVVGYDTGQGKVSREITKKVRPGLSRTLLKHFQGKEVLGIIWEYSGEGSNI